MSDLLQLALRRQDLIADCLLELGFTAEPPLPLRHLVRADGDRLAYDDPDSQVSETDGAKMTARFVVSTVREDRAGDIVMPEGCKDSLADYQKNPAVFFSHRSYGKPIGSSYQDLQCSQPGVLVEDGRGITATVKFHGKTQESEEVFRLVECGDLRCASIGFLPVLAEKIKRKSSEDDDLPKGQFKFDPWFPLKFLKWNLHEWSVVPVPCNADCVAMRLSRGFAGKQLSEPVRKALEPYAAPSRFFRAGFEPLGQTQERLQEAALRDVPVAQPVNLDEKLQALEERLTEKFTEQLAVTTVAQTEALTQALAGLLPRAPEPVPAPKQDHKLVEALHALAQQVAENHKALRRITGRVS